MGAFTVRPKYEVSAHIVSSEKTISMEAYMKRSMNTQDITRVIEDRAAPDFGLWTIGVTGDPKAAKQMYINQGNDVKDWLEWQADSADTARTVEDHFLDEGMKGSEGGHVDATAYVFIF